MFESMGDRDLAAHAARFKDDEFYQYVRERATNDLVEQWRQADDALQRERIHAQLAGVDFLESVLQEIIGDGELTAIQEGVQGS